MDLSQLTSVTKLSLDEIADLAYLKISEGLNKHSRAFEAWYASASKEDQMLFQEELDAASILILACAPTVEAPDLDLSILTSGEAALPPGFSHLRAEEGDWKELPVKGARIKELASDDRDGFVTMLLELDPGTKFPGHQHHGAEHVYLLDGDLVTDGRTLSPGDFLRACADTYHNGLSSEYGCHALIITARPNFPVKAVRLYERASKAVKRLIGKKGKSLP